CFSSFLYYTSSSSFILFFNHPFPSVFSSLSLHDALPISISPECTPQFWRVMNAFRSRRSMTLLSIARSSWRDAQQCHGPPRSERSEEHTSELQSRSELVCRLLLEKKKKKYKRKKITIKNI